jgi:hypothetical protein
MSCNDLLYTFRDNSLNCYDTVIPIGLEWNHIIFGIGFRLQPTYLTKSSNICVYYLIQFYNAL